MRIDARSLVPNSTLEAEICVIGGGAAGITLARELGALDKDVLLLESGAIELEPETQKLYEGHGDGTLIQPATNYLGVSRLRQFGGSTNHWDGWCRPLDPIDFEERSWVPDSGWPFGHEYLEPYVRRAAAVCQIKEFTPELMAAFQKGEPHPFGEDRLRVSRFHISPPTRFGERYRKELDDSATVRAVLNANVTEIVAAPSGGRIERLRVRTLVDGAPDAEHTVRAGVFVLAAGGIENPRLLLASNSVHRNGLGNEHDNVGRYFSDHPVGRVAYVLLPRQWHHMTCFRIHQRDRWVGLLQLSAEVQREHQVLNSLILFDKLEKWHHKNLYREIGTVPFDMDRLLATEEPPEGTDYLAYVRVATEQAPNRGSRVTLDPVERDALGMPRGRLEWPCASIDEESIRRTIEALGRELAIEGVGRVKGHFSTPVFWDGIGYSNHHMGATRMHADPKRGVVDADARVHGIDNLFVAGSSVFPTVGCSNPTLAIVALTLRLAEHLAVKVVS